MPAYPPTLWQDDQVPAINATNLNKLTNELIAQAVAQSVPHTLQLWTNGTTPAVSDPTNLNEMERVTRAVGLTLTPTVNYTVTTWQAGWVPARNAANLNKLEQAVAANRTAIDAGSATADFFVTKSGNDTTGNGSQGAPWLTVKKATDTVLTSGKKISVGAGTFTETGTLTLANGVSLVGAGVASTTIRTTLTGATQQMLTALGGTGATISDILFDGQNRTTTGFGVYIRNTTGMTVTRIKAQGFKNTVNEQGSAIDFQGVTNFVLSNSTFTTSGGTSVLPGPPALTVSNGVVGIGSCNGALLDYVTVVADGNAYAVKRSGSGSTLTNLEIRNSSFTQTSASAVSDITFELWTSVFVGCRLHHNFFDGIVSLTGPQVNPSIGNPKTNGGTSRIRLDHNYWNITQGSRYCVEMSSNSMEVDHNYVKSSGLYPWSYFEGQTLHDDWIHHNVTDMNFSGARVAVSHFDAGVQTTIYEKNTAVTRQNCDLGFFNSNTTGNANQFLTNILYASAANILGNCGTSPTFTNNTYFNVSPASGTGAITTTPALTLAFVAPTPGSTSWSAGYTPPGGNASAARGAVADGVFEVGPL